MKKNLNLDKVENHLSFAQEHISNLKLVDEDSKDFTYNKREAILELAFTISALSDLEGD